MWPLAASLSLSHSSAPTALAHRTLPISPYLQVGAKSLLEIAADLQRLQADASAGKLGMADLKGGTFSLSNIGNLGGTYTGPVINLPEVAIAGLGKARPTPKYDEQGNLVKRMVMQVSWSADHRVIDGATMARFSNAWIGYLEKPATMLLHL